MTVENSRNNWFSNEQLTAEESFWVMFYFLERHYELSGGHFDLSDILSASQPFEFNKKGHFDGQALGYRKVAPADSAMIYDWNAAIKKFKEQGLPPTSILTKRR